MTRTITTAGPHGMREGEIVQLNGRPHRLVLAGNTTVIVVPLQWRERLALWLRQRVRIRGFWSRVWDSAR